MQDPDKTIAIPSGHGAQEWPQGQAPAAQPGQFPPSPYGQPPTPQAAYGQSNQAPGPGQFAAYTPQSRPGFPQAPGNPQPQKKRTLLWASLGALVLLLLGIGGVLAFTHTPAQNTTAQSQSTAATAQASQSASGKNASASSSAQSGASSDNNSLQAQATAVATALAQAQSQAQANNLPGQAQALAQAGAPADVATSFFAAIQRQDYATAYKYTSFKNMSSDSFQRTSTTSDQALGKLTAYSIGKTTMYPGATSTSAQVAVTITRANISSHAGLALLTLENGTWKITDGTVWQ